MDAPHEDTPMTETAPSLPSARFGLTEEGRFDIDGADYVIYWDGSYTEVVDIDTWEGDADAESYSHWCADTVDLDRDVYVAAAIHLGRTIYAGGHGMVEVPAAATALYRIENSSSGTHLGDFDADSTEHALDALACYADHAAAQTEFPTDALLVYEIPAAARDLLDAVLVERMPEHLRASHEAARNAGVWPHNGSERVIMRAQDAADAVGLDPVWTEIVRPVRATDWTTYELDLWE